MTARMLFGATAVLALAASGAAFAQQQPLRIVGSSTVFPFAAAVAERFAQTSGFPAPVVESTGTGGGIKLFCAGVGEGTPDMANASRQMKESELAECAANGVTPVEVRLGYDGIVLAGSKEGPALEVTREQLFLALAKQLPDAAGDLAPNPYRTWVDIDPALPAEKIEVLGPPPTSGTRDAFVELVMAAACVEAVKAAETCADIREDGAYVEAGENDNLIVQKLAANPHAFGIFGFSFLDQNSDSLRGATIDGVEPTFEAIAAGSYPVSRSLFVYVKKEHVGRVAGVEEFVGELTSDAAWGDEGYLAEKGLIPLSPEERAKSAEAAKSMQPLTL